MTSDIAASAMSEMIMAVEAADRARVQALVSGDSAALRDTLHSDLTYIHSHGQVDDLARYIDDFESGIVVYEKVVHDIEVTQADERVALAVGLMSVAGTVAGRSVEFRSRTMAVWVFDGVVWRLRGFHSSRTGGDPGRIR